MKVELIDYMGNDNSVVTAARVSFARSAHDYTQEQNAKLIKYLATHNHFTTFTHCFVSLAMTAPIAIKAQCDKHVVGFTSNTESRRYISNRPELYVPDFWRTKPIGNVKQGSGGLADNNEYWQNAYERHCNAMVELYERMIKADIAPEQARFVLPQGVETNWVWTGSLYAWARFYNLRTDPHAQKEIQDLAKMVGKIIEPLYPVSWQALTRQSENHKYDDTVPHKPTNFSDLPVSVLCQVHRERS